MGGKLLLAAWRIAPRLPRVLLRAIGYLAAQVVWLARGKGVRQLEANLARVVEPNRVRAVARRGLHSYAIYWLEALIMSTVTGAEVDARVRCDNPARLHQVLAADGTSVLALGHLGNYDLAGAWASRHLKPIVTVAERLEPPELFTQFRQFRRALGMTIYAHTGEDAFRQLIRHLKGGDCLIALLADRDLSAAGVEVNMWGQTVSVAAGPAALARATGVSIIPTAITYERLHGQRRRQARWPWGIVLHFGEPYYVSKEGGAEQAVALASQHWADHLAGVITAHPQDWHMLAKVFVADLDPARYRQAAR